MRVSEREFLEEIVIRNTLVVYKGKKAHLERLI